MRALTLEQIAEWTGGELVRGSAQAVVTRVSTDSREDLAGALFVPLAGERFDAHAFIPQALAQGAVAALTVRSGAPADAGALIAVDDPLAALQRLAARYRESMPALVAVGVTGSNGKTSTKDFLAGVLARKFKVHATKGNLNNHIGVPLTLLGLEPDHTAGIFEMGMNHFGEIAPLAAMVRPEVAVVTNIGTAHIEFLGSREGIAQEKGALVEAVGAHGVVVLNADDDMTPALAARASARVVTAGISAGEVRAGRVEGPSFDLLIPGAAPVRVRLPVPGRHMINNALLAAAVGWRLGLEPGEIRAGLEASRLHGGRLQFREAGGLHFLDDSYNANPDSMKAALRTLREQPVAGRRIAVLGRMGELGPHAEAGHRAVGLAAATEGVDFLLTIGEGEAKLMHESFGDAGRSRWCANHEEAVSWLRSEAAAEDLVLLKGSRSAAMERVLAGLGSPADLTHP